MDWKNLTKNLSGALDTVRNMGETASQFVENAMQKVEKAKAISDVVKADGSIVSKGIAVIQTAFPEICEADNSQTPTDIIIEEKIDCVPQEDNIPEAIESPLACVTALANMGTEVAKAVQVCQIEETKRTEINAKMEIEVAKINAISNLLSEYLNKTFDERADLFDNYFNILDTAIRNGDTALMSATLSSINSLAAQSPFKNLSDVVAVQQQLGASDTEWDI